MEPEVIISQEAPAHWYQLFLAGIRAMQLVNASISSLHGMDDAETNTQIIRCCQLST